MKKIIWEKQNYQWGFQKLTIRYLILRYIIHPYAYIRDNQIFTLRSSRSSYELFYDTRKTLSISIYIVSTDLLQKTFKNASIIQQNQKKAIGLKYINFGPCRIWNAPFWIELNNNFFFLKHKSNSFDMGISHCTLSHTKKILLGFL